MYNEQKITSLVIRSQSQNNNSEKMTQQKHVVTNPHCRFSRWIQSPVCSAASKTTKVWDFKRSPFTLNKSHHWEFSAHTTCEILGKAAENNAVELGSCAISLPDDLALLWVTFPNLHLICTWRRADCPPSHQPSSNHTTYLYEMCVTTQVHVSVPSRWRAPRGQNPIYHFCVLADAYPFVQQTFNIQCNP